MTKLDMIKQVLPTAALVMLSGCISFGAKPPPSLLTLTPSTLIAADTVRSAQNGEPVAVAIPTSPQAIATNRVAVDDGPTTIAYIKDAVWVEAPARQFARLLTEAIGVKTGRVVQDARLLNPAPGITVSGHLAHFEIDAARSEALIVFDAVMSRGRASAVQTRRFEAHVPIVAVTATDAGIALNRGANEVAAAVATWVAGG